MDARQIRGMEIAEQGRITQTKKGWIVPGFAPKVAFAPKV